MENKDKLLKIYLPLIFIWLPVSCYLIGCLDTLLGLNTVNGYMYYRSYKFFYQLKYIIYNPDTWKNVAMLFVVGAAFFYFLFTLTFKKKGTDERDFVVSSSGAYGTSGWMTEEERIKVLDVKPQEETDGVILGQFDTNVVSLPKPIPNTPSLNRHIAVFGPSGSRKTRSFVMPAIMQSVVNNESIILSDPKGELYEKSSSYLKKHGYKVRLLNLVEPSHSDSWAILFELGEPDEHQSMAQLMADIIMKNTEHLDRLDFWGKGELNLLKALILYVFRDPNRNEYDKSLGAVYNLISNVSEPQLNQIFDTLPPGHPAITPYNIFRKGNDTVREGVFFGLGTRLQLFQDDNIKRITSYREIDLTAPGKEKCAYFLKVSDQDTTMTFIQSMFFSFLFIKLVRFADRQPQKECIVPVNFILDEFPNIGVIPDFAVKMSTIRSRGLRVSIIFQMISQLETWYEDKWKEILGNCDTHLVLGVNDPDSADFVSKRCGVITIETTTDQVVRKSIPFDDYVPTYRNGISLDKRDLVNYDETFRIGNNDAIVILRGEKPLKVQKFDYSNHSHTEELVLVQTSDHIPDWRQRRIDNETPKAPIEPCSRESFPTTTDATSNTRPTSSNRVLKKISPLDTRQNNKEPHPNILPTDIPDDKQKQYSEEFTQSLTDKYDTISSDTTDTLNPEDMLSQYVTAIKNQAKDKTTDMKDSYVSDVKMENGKKTRTLVVTKLLTDDADK